MKRRKILVFQHVPFEPLGNLDPMLKQAGFRIRYVNFSRDPLQRPNLDDYVGLIVLGGPMNVDQAREYPNLSTEIVLIKEAVERGIRVLGICLGAQLLAVALGSTVRAASQKEIGWYDVNMQPDAKDDPILGLLNSCEKIFQWHGDQIELPQGAKLLASSTQCEVQAFSYGDRCYGFQFHLEVDQALIERWLTVPGNVEELELVKHYIDAEHIRRQTPIHLPAMQNASEQVFGQWIAQFEIGKRKRRLPSR